MVFKCKYLEPVSHGTLLLIIWNLLLSAACGFIVTVLQILKHEEYNLMMMPGLCVLLPVAGWMGELPGKISSRCMMKYSIIYSGFITSCKGKA